MDPVRRGGVEEGVQHSRHEGIAGSAGVDEDDGAERPTGRGLRREGSTHAAAGRERRPSPPAGRQCRPASCLGTALRHPRRSSSRGGPAEPGIPPGAGRLLAGHDIGTNDGVEAEQRRGHSVGEGGVHRGCPRGPSAPRSNRGAPAPRPPRRAPGTARPSRRRRGLSPSRRGCPPPEESAGNRCCQVAGPRRPRRDDGRSGCRWSRGARSRGRGPLCGRRPRRGTGPVSPARRSPGCPGRAPAARRPGCSGSSPGPGSGRPRRRRPR